MLNRIAQYVRRFISDVHAGLTYPFKHRPWPLTLLLGGGLFFIPLVGSVLVAMYQDSVLRTVLRDPSNPPPNLWDLFRHRRLLLDVLLDLVGGLINVTI